MISNKIVYYELSCHYCGHIDRCGVPLPSKSLYGNCNNCGAHLIIFSLEEANQEPIEVTVQNDLKTKLPIIKKRKIDPSLRNESKSQNHHRLKGDRDK